MTELTNILDRYLKSAADLREIAEWLAGVDWDDPKMTEDEQEAFGLIELLVTEVAEGMRDEADLRTEAERFVVDKTSPVIR